MSVVIPCYGKSSYLESCVTSVVNSTYKNIEILVCSDGDNSSEIVIAIKKIIEKYPDLIVCDYGSNRGISYCRNYMISKSNGKYILPIDGDDFIHHNFIEEAVDILENNVNAGLVYSLTVNYFQQRNKLKPWVDLLYNDHESIGAVHFIPSCNMFRKVTWHEVGGYDESLRLGWEDLDFNFKRVNLNQKFVRIDKFYFFYRMLEKSRSTDFHQDEGDVLRHKILFMYKYIDTYARYAATYNYLNSKKSRYRKRLSKLKIKFLFLKEYLKIKSVCLKYK